MHMLSYTHLLRDVSLSIYHQLVCSVGIIFAHQIKSSLRHIDGTHNARSTVCCTVLGFTAIRPSHWAESFVVAFKESLLILTGDRWGNIKRLQIKNLEYMTTQV